LVAVAAAGFSRLNERLQTIGAGDPGSSLERLRRMGEEYVRFAVENPAHYRLMYGKEALPRQDRAELRDAAIALFEQLVGVILAHQKSGGLDWQNPRAQAYVAWSAVHGLASLWLEGHILATDDIDGHIRQTARTVIEGMRWRMAGGR
jgi:AcrR family transcriptional regulator